MLDIDIPGSRSFHLHHLVLDFNGTIAEDGEVVPVVMTQLKQLESHLTIHVLTADTHGTVARNLKGLPVQLQIIGPTEQDREKRAYLEKLGSDRCVALGNGRNDALMLEAAALGIGIIGKEGGSAQLLTRAEVICCSIEDALNLLLKPDRLRATLRN